MGNRKSKIATAVIDKPIVSTPKESHASSLVVEPTVPEVVVMEPVVIAADVVVTGSNAVEEPPVTEPPVTEPSVTEPPVEEPPTVSEQPIVSEVVVSDHFAVPALDPIQEVDERAEAEAQARPTVKSDSSRSLKITFMSASHDPYAYLPKKEQPETKSKHGKKFKKHHAKMEAEKMVDPPSSTNIDDMD
jgi:hypothetical protein